MADRTPRPDPDDRKAPGQPPPGQPDDAGTPPDAVEPAGPAGEAEPVDVAEPVDAAAGPVDVAEPVDTAEPVDAADGRADAPDAAGPPDAVEDSGSAEPDGEDSRSADPDAEHDPGAEPVDEDDQAQPADADDAAEPVGAVAAGPAGGAPAWRRVARALTHPRITGANAIIALLIGLLGFALIAQVKSNANESTLANDRPDDLVRILSDLDSRKDRLSTEIATLQETVRQLNSGAAGRQAALDAAAKRADELGILAGTLPAQGPGLVITLRPQAGQQMDAAVVLNTVEELRGAGAEAMQITGTGGPGVRVVASTSFVTGTGGVTMGDQTLGGALTVSVIGDPQTMQTAMSIPGGVLDTVRGAGGTVQIDQPTLVRVTLLHQAAPLRYAHPAS